MADAYPRPQEYWLTNNATDKARFHIDPACTGLRWAQERAEKHDVALTDLLVRVPADDVDELTHRRLLCRACALEGATVRVLTTPDPTGRDVTVTVAAAAPGREPSETAVARLLNVAAATQLTVATGGRAAAVLYGVVPAQALDFLDRNFDIALPPPGLRLVDDIVTIAWSINTRLGDTEWQAAAAACL